MHVVMYGLRSFAKNSSNPLAPGWRWSICVANALLMFTACYCSARPAGQVVHRVIAWGDLNYALTLNNVAPGQQNVLAQIAAGDFHSLALQNDGSVLAW